MDPLQLEIHHVLLFQVHIKDVLMGIPNIDLLGMAMAVIHVAGQWIPAEDIQLQWQLTL